jgi:hypothetical protein
VNVNDAAMVGLLLGAGADPDLVDQKGRTPRRKAHSAEIKALLNAR